MQLCDNLWAIKKSKKGFIFSKSSHVTPRTHHLLFTSELCAWLVQRFPQLNSAFALKDPAWHLLETNEYRLLEEFGAVRVTTSDFRGIAYLHIRAYRDGAPTKRGFAFTQQSWPAARDFIALNAAP
jgi:hypothetical protein